MARRKRGSIDYPFIALPRALITSETWQALPHAARVLAIDLMSQYTGRNNGRLCPAFEVMKRSGWASKDTLARAKRALLDSPFALQTRMGHPPRTAEWIGFLWWRLDYDRTMDVDPAKWPRWGFMDPPKANPKNTFCPPKTVPITPSIGPESVPMEARK